MGNNNRDRDDSRPSAPAPSSPGFTFTQTVTSGSSFGGSAPSRPSAPSGGGRAADPVVAASSRPLASQGRVVASPRDGVPQSLSEQSDGYYYTGDGTPVYQVGPSPQSVALAPLRRTNLTITPPKHTAPDPARVTKLRSPDPVKKKPPAPARVTKEPTQVKSTRETSSPQAREQITCKARPTDNRPRRGGGGKKRGFIPWC